MARLALLEDPEGRQDQDTTECLSAPCNVRQSFMHEIYLADELLHFCQPSFQGLNVANARMSTMIVR